MSVQQQPLTLQTQGSSGLFTTGLALFSMFFGAGNLIFPLLIGKTSGTNVWYAISGLGVTAVVMPLLGIAAMVLYQGDYHRFFGRVGRVPGLLLLMLLQFLLGPFGVIPRLITLMHAMAAPYLMDVPLPLFSVLAAGLIFACSFQREKLVGFLGAILTPVLLLSLGALIFFGWISGTAMESSAEPATSSFFKGLIGGYQTMDLVAAFLFATVVLPHFQKDGEGRVPLKKIFFSSGIAASLLLLSYIGLAIVSAYHGAALAPDCPPEQLLSAIATRLLGPAGGCIAAIAVLTACLTTAMTLASIFADYLHKDVCKRKIGDKSALIATLVVATLFANLGFSGIAAFLGPILQVAYPGLILLTVLNLLHALYGQQMVKLPVFAAFVGSAVVYCL